MASISSLMLFITYLLLFNIFSNGLAFMNDGNNADTYKGADIATIGNSDADMSEGGKLLLIYFYDRSKQLVKTVLYS